MAVFTMAWLVTPVFIALAVFNYFMSPPLCVMPGPLDFLSSMWLMYLLMAIAHAALWWDFFVRKTARLKP
jgi:hypothetical protein